MSTADRLLSTLTNGACDSKQAKVIDMSEYGNPKEFFMIGRKFLGCIEQMEMQQFSLSDCVQARAYCDAVMLRYIVLLDNATFMPSEHIQKEKEYGITWRTAFKQELKNLVEVVTRKLMPDETPNEDPFETLHTLIKKDCIDAATFDSRT